MNFSKIYKVTFIPLRMFMVRKLSKDSLNFLKNEYINRLLCLNLFNSEINKKKKMKEMDYNYYK